MCKASWTENLQVQYSNLTAEEVQKKTYNCTDEWLQSKLMFNKFHLLDIELRDAIVNKMFISLLVAEYAYNCNNFPLEKVLAMVLGTSSCFMCASKGVVQDVKIIVKMKNFYRRRELYSFGIHLVASMKHHLLLRCAVFHICTCCCSFLRYI